MKEIGKKRGRKEDLQERKRLTASAAFHGIRIKDNYEALISKIKTIPYEFVNMF